MYVYVYVVLCCVVWSDALPPSTVSGVCDGFLRCCSVLHCPQDRGVHNVHKAKHRPTVAFRALA